MDLADEQVYGNYAAELLRFAAGLVGPSAVPIGRDRRVREALRDARGASGSCGVDDGA